MDLFASQVPAALSLVAAGANRSTVVTPSLWSSATVRDMLAADAQYRPSGQAAASRGYAARYLGDQRAIVMSLLRERYPKSASRMHPAPIGYVRMWGRADAGCYQQEADRYLAVDGVRVEDDTLQAAMAKRLEGARVSEVAPECERRACAGIRSVAVHVGHIGSLDGDPSREVLTHYWPHDVCVITHPAYPGEDAAMIFVALRQPTAIDERGQTVDRWLCYQRDYTDDESGMPATWGPWQTAMWRADMPDVEWQEYEGTVVPVAVLRIEPPDGGFWPAPDVDSLRAADQLNMSRTNADFILDLQAHSILTISDDAFDEQDANASPDSVLALKSGGSAQFLTPAPAFDAMAASTTERQETLAAARGNDPNAYSAKAGAPESGIARLVAKFPHELTLRERREAVRRFDERLCRIILDVSDAYAPDATTFGDMRVKTDLAPSVVFEDPASKLTRAQQILDAGAISPAEFVVEVGRYRHVEEAKAAGYSDEARMRMPEEAAPSVSAMLTPAETSDAVVPNAPAVDDVASLALNGAQVGSLIEVVGLIASKSLPPATGREIITAAFPAIAPDVVDRMLAGLRGFTPAAPEATDAAGE